MQSPYTNRSCSLERVEEEKLLTPSLIKLIRQLSHCDCGLGISINTEEDYMAKVTVDISKWMEKERMQCYREIVLLDILTLTLMEEGSLSPIYYSREEELEDSLYMNIGMCLAGRPPYVVPERGIYLMLIDYSNNTHWPIIRVGSATEVFRALDIIRQVIFEKRLSDWNGYCANNLQESLVLKQLGPERNAEVSFRKY